MAELKVRVPRWETCVTPEEGFEKGLALGFPLLIRPSFVLGGQAMEIVRTPEALHTALRRASQVSGVGSPVLMDCYLEGAREYDVDLLCDGCEVFIPAIMEHIEEAGIHSGDSHSVIPPQHLQPGQEKTMREVSARIALRLGVKGLLNIQFAWQGQDLYVIEVNPRSSRSVPFVAKATGIEMARLAAKIALGKTLAELLPKKEDTILKKAAPICIKSPIFPFAKFAGVLPALGPQMQSIGETMSLGGSFSEAMSKAFACQGIDLKRVKKWILVATQEAFLAQESQLFKAVFEFMKKGHGKVFMDSETHATWQRIVKLEKGIDLPNEVFSMPCCVPAEELLHTVENNTEAFVLVPTLFGFPSHGERELGERLLRTSLRKRVPFSTSCLAASALTKAFGESTQTPEKQWKLHPLYENIGAKI
jgi:hypothetical protein